ncbi:hypothetical protein SAMN05428967_4491 [Phyllobacterium sp. YR620]|uniref:YfbU family protein n=1 Tax=Phyllobacterium sp. YR620 TaxID=1881066 RepID=UPI0008896476|nr:YfbU family protein [Phyllobacterium sp. YR620]SDP92648.1 hypothetical protein SAMN05428967_4491 [Phyllobacterium sp. YR620]
MTPKTERFELRLDADTIERVDQWRGSQGDTFSRSEAVRRLIDRGLDAHTPEGFRLNKSERLMTWLLTEILKNQINAGKDKQDSKYEMKKVELIQEVIYGGHFWALDWELSGVMHNEVDDPKALRTVVDVLDTWTFIERAYAGFSNDDKKRIEEEVGFRGKNPRFKGFDGNNETDYMGIAHFLVDQLGRFENFKGRDFNSHTPTVARYSQMAAIFSTMRSSLLGRELSPNEIIQLLKFD